MKLKWTLPSVEAIDDAVNRRILVAIRDNLSNIVGNVMSKDELVEIGILAKNKAGQYVAMPPTPPSASPENLPAYLSVGYTSVDWFVSASTTGSGYFSFALPTNSRVIRSWFEVVTPFTVTGGPGVDVFINYDGVNPTHIFNPMALTVAGVFEGLQLGTTATFSEKTTSPQSLQYNITGGTLEAGGAVMFLEYAVIN